LECFSKPDARAEFWLQYQQILGMPLQISTITSAGLEINVWNDVEREILLLSGSRKPSRRVL
jgi:hypothetical protein